MPGLSLSPLSGARGKFKPVLELGWCGLTRDQRLPCSEPQGAELVEGVWSGSKEEELIQGSRSISPSRSCRSSLCMDGTRAGFGVSQAETLTPSIPLGPNPNVCIPIPAEPNWSLAENGSKAGAQGHSCTEFVSPLQCFNPMHEGWDGMCRGAGCV